MEIKQDKLRELLLIAGGADGDCPCIYNFNNSKYEKQGPCVNPDSDNPGLSCYECWVEYIKQDYTPNEHQVSGTLPKTMKPFSTVLLDNSENIYEAALASVSE